MNKLKHYRIQSFHGIIAGWYLANSDLVLLDEVCKRIGVVSPVGFYEVQLGQMCILKANFSNPKLLISKKIKTINPSIKNILLGAVAVRMFLRFKKSTAPLDSVNRKK